MGAALGAWLRYALAWLSIRRNPHLPWAHCIEPDRCYLIGIAMAYFANHPALPGNAPVVITGFLGGLTTFLLLGRDVNLLMPPICWALPP